MYNTYKSERIFAFCDLKSSTYVYESHTKQLSVKKEDEIMTVCSGVIIVTSSG